MKSTRIGAAGLATLGVFMVLAFWTSPASAAQNCEFTDTATVCSGGFGSGGRQVLTDPTGQSDGVITISGGGGEGGHSKGDFTTGEFFTTFGRGGGGRVCFQGLEQDFGIPDGCFSGGGGSGQHCSGNLFDPFGIECVGGGPGRPLLP